MLLLAGCGIAGGGEEPASAADYAKTLAEVDASLKAPLAAVAKDEKGAFETSATALEAGAGKLAAVTAPESVTSAHQSLVDALRDLGDGAQAAAGGKPKCPAASPAAELLRSRPAEAVRAQAKSLAEADPSFVVGAFLPAAPKEQNRRLANGAFVKKKGGSGRGELIIENGSGDTTVSLVPKGTKKPNFTVYVRGDRKFTVTDVKAGTYEIFAAAGEDYDRKRKGFTRECSFTKFGDPFEFEPAGVRWTITLKETVGGNAETAEVDPGEFPTEE